MYTKRDYPVLNQFMDEFSSQGFVVLGFPTAQFENQEPGEGDEIMKCLFHVRPGGSFVPNFPLLEKTDPNGRSEHAMWTWLKRQCPLPTTFNYGALRWTPVTAHDVGWNFEKVLVDRNGHPCRRYAATVPAADLRADIQEIITRGCVRTNSRCAVSGASRL